MTVQEVLDVAIKSKNENGIEGVTFLGGEPTLQEGVPYLADELKKAGIGTILFTGRCYESLSAEIINSVDLIVDGRFIFQQIDYERNLVGSKNQRIIYVTDRYVDCENWFQSARGKKIEMNLNEDLFINGDVL